MDNNTIDKKKKVNITVKDIIKLILSSIVVYMLTCGVVFYTDWFDRYFTEIWIVLGVLTAYIVITFYKAVKNKKKNKE